MILFLPNRLLTRRLFRWHIDYFDSRRIQGWVGCRKEPRSACLVSCRDRQGVLGTIFTTIPRPDVAVLGYEMAGFRLVFDREIVGSIDVTASSPAASINWKALERRLLPTGCGVVENISLSRITGWAVPPQRRPGESVTVALRRGNMEVASTELFIQRHEIAAAYELDDSLLGFDLRLPLEITIGSHDLFTLEARYGERSFVIKDGLSFTGREPGFERSLAFDQSSQRWV